jgi:hypothetical protein
MLGCAVASMLVLLSACGAASTARQAQRTPTATVIATATAAPRTWTTIPSLSGLPAALIIAPSDPRVVYEAGLVVPSKTSSTLYLQRTDDEGATWHTLALPSVVPTTLQFIHLFVSSQDAQSVFITVFGGGFLGQFHSADGGQDWTPLMLPPGGWIGGFLPSGNVPPDRVVRVQSSRLYSSFGPVLGSSGGATPGGRLVRSTDGGTAWEFADAPLYAAGQSIWDFAPNPTGDTVFAVTQPTHQYAGPIGQIPPLQLWRTDDAGDHWSLVGSLPVNNEAGMRVVLDESTNRELLYVQMGPAAADLRASADGGHTWTGAPTSGLPSPSGTGPLPSPVGVLADGSVIVGDADFYAWKLGDTTWRQIAPGIGGAVWIVPAGVAGPAALWETGNSGKGFVVQRFPLG